ncbi:hypothetical protein EON65_44310 [archaeon]|nr:MAG: hypothetical protein EON65_44310 [archaeon]
MGTTASTSSLTKDQKSFITQKLQKVYDEHAGSMDPAELSKSLSTEYNRLAESFTRLNHDDPAQHKKKDDEEPSSMRLTKSSFSAPPGGSLTLSTKGSSKMQPKASGSKCKNLSLYMPTSYVIHHNTPCTIHHTPYTIHYAYHTMKHIEVLAYFSNSSQLNAATPVGSKGRRRSFDMSSKKLNSGSSKNNVTTANLADAEVSLTKSQSDLSPLTEVVGDSWDSVTTQPYCETCKMAFKSLAFLERHVKFSSLHADNEKKAKEAGLAALVSPPKPTKKELVTQEEGMHYR